MEYWCHMCMEWEDAAYCESHFEFAHGQKKVTFEELQKRLGSIGGLNTRESVIDDKPEEEPKPKSWMWRDDKDPNGMLVTNNFRHTLDKK